MGVLLIKWTSRGLTHALLLSLDVPERAARPKLEPPRLREDPLLPLNVVRRPTSEAWAFRLKLVALSIRELPML